jgi:tetratricopeptide (TPR) repeat protein
VSAVPRKFDVSLLAKLDDQAADDDDFCAAIRSLLEMPFVIRRHDGLFRIHDGIRAALLSQLEQTTEGTDLVGELNRRLAAWYSTEHDQARRIAHQFDFVAELMWRVSPGRMLTLQSAIEKQLVTPLVEALHHATVADPDDCGHAQFKKWFDLYQGESRIGICRLLLRSWRDDLERLYGGVAANDAWDWRQYYKARLSLAERDREAAREGAASLLARPDVRSEIRLRSQELVTESLIEDCRLGEALDQVSITLDMLDKEVHDPGTRSRVFSQQARINHLLYDGEARSASLSEAVRAARDAGDRESEATLLSELSAHQAAEGSLADAADAALRALHIVRTIRSPSAMTTAKRFASRLMRSFGASDPGSANLFHIEATHLISGDDVRSTVEVEGAYVSVLIRTGQFEHAHNVLDQLEKRIGDNWIAQQSDVQILRANLLDAQGREKEAVERNRQTAGELKRQHGNTWNHAAALTNAASTDMDFGDRLEEASTAAIEAAKLWSSMGHSRGLALTNVILAEVGRRRADYESARARLGSERPAPAMGLEDLWYKTAARVADDLGQYGEAERYLRIVLESSYRRGQLRVAARTSALLVELLIRAGDLDAAIDMAGKLTQIASSVRELRHYQPSAASTYANEHNGRAVRLLTMEAKHLNNPIRSAIQHLEEAVDSDPGPFWYSLNQAYAFLRLGKRTAALEAMDSAAAKASGTHFEEAVNHLTSEISHSSS